MDINHIQHILRNPWGKSAEEKRAAQLAAADLLDDYLKPYECEKIFSEAKQRLDAVNAEIERRQKRKQAEQAKPAG